MKVKNGQIPNKELSYFFAYGIFRPGEIPFLGIDKYVSQITKITIKGKLLVRDGIILIINGNENIKGFLLEFKNNQKDKAYDHIMGLEPMDLFAWAEGEFETIKFNILTARKEEKNTRYLDVFFDYPTTKNDPYFIEGIEKLKKYSNSIPDKFHDNIDHVFDIQMRYLFLWIIFERFLLLRYGFGKHVTPRLKKISEDPIFKKALIKYVNTDLPNRTVFYAGSGEDSVSLDPKNELDSINYYYKIRNNITHRGKIEKENDFMIIKNSFIELLKIVDEIISHYINECHKIEDRYKT